MWAQLAAEEEAAKELPDATTEEMLAAMGATPGAVQGIGGGGGRSRRGCLRLGPEAMTMAVGNGATYADGGGGQICGFPVSCASSLYNQAAALVPSEKLVRLQRARTVASGRQPAIPQDHPPAGLAFGVDMELD